MLYRYRAGIAWRDLPERFGHFRNVRTRFTRWSNAGVWARLLRVLAADASNEHAMIDSTIVRAHQCSSGGLSSKIHALVDAHGRPIALHLTPGQAGDLDGADALLPSCSVRCANVDRGDETFELFIEPLRATGKLVVAPSTRSRKTVRRYSRRLYAKRHRIENFFARLKLYRAIATRYDTTAVNFLGAIHLACAIHWLNR